MIKCSCQCGTGIILSTVTAEVKRGDDTIALTNGFGLADKRGYSVEIEEIQFAMVTLSAWT